MRLKGASTNVNGLGAYSKRYAIVRKAIDEKFDFTFLQETHLNEQLAQKFEKEFPGAKFLWSHGTSKERGLGFMYTSNDNVKYDLVKRDEEGRFIHIKCTWST